SIPVGIAVAQIRPHHVHQPRDHVSVSGASQDHRARHASPTGTIRPKPSPAPHLTRASDAHQSGLTQGHNVASSTWTPQVSQFSPGQPQARCSTGPRYPVSAPEGFKFIVDPTTKQVFLVHSEDLEEQTSAWPVASIPVPSIASPGRVKSNSILPTVTVHSPELRQDPIGKTNSKDGRQDNPAEIASIKSSRELRGHKSETTNNSIVSSLPRATAESSGLLWTNFQSRGCSPILCEEFSSPLSLLSTLSSLSSRKPTTSSIGIQVGEVHGRGRKKLGSLSQHLSSDRGVQTSPLTAATSPRHYHPQASASLPPSSSASSSSKTLKPLPSHCQPLKVKVGEDDSGELGSCLYNPFTDPQILQAAHGLELLSTLAEKRPKCSSSSAASSLDDPKHIYPSPSDSYDTLSPTVDLSAESAMSKSGHPRCEVRRELSPKWTRPKKEPQDGVLPGDFKPPPELELAHDLDVRVKLVEVQRQYKEKQRGLAKLQSKKLDTSGAKLWKRGPGRPPKKKTQIKKSDDDSSSSSSKPKDGHHQQQKKKRPAEELVDRIYRKLPPPEKPNKVSRSIHYVKSKTGPFFRRKSASSSVKKNKDMFGGDPSTWPSFSERKHQEKVKHGKDKYKASYVGDLDYDCKSHYIFKSKEHKSSHVKDTGNIFANLQKSCAGGDIIESGLRPSKSQLLKSEHSQSNQDLSNSLAISAGAMKAESSSTSSSSQLSGLGLLAKFALTTAASTPANSAPSVISSSTLTVLPSASGNLSSSTAFSTHTPSSSSSSTPYVPSTQSLGCFSSSHGLASGPSSNSSTFNNNTASMSTTFGSISSFMVGQSIGLFNNTNNNNNGNPDKSKFIPASCSSSHRGNSAPPATVMAIPTTTMSTTLSTGIAATVVVTSNSDITLATSTATSPAVVISAAGQPQQPAQLQEQQTSESSSLEQEGASGSTTESGSSKRKADDDSDTDTSDTSPNKKRKPGRPRKINPDKSSGGTETIWAKKSCHLQDNNNVNDPKRPESDFNTPLFLDDEWSRRRSERIFLSESGPSSSLGVSTTGFSMSAAPPSAVSPRSNSSEQHVWKLSHFMPKSKKLQEPKSSQGRGESSSGTEIKTEQKEDPPVGVSLGGKQGKPQEAFTKKSSTTTAKEESSFSSSPSPVPQKAKRGRKPKGDKLKAKKLRKETEATSSSPSPPKLVKKEHRSDEVARMKQQKSKNLHNITQRVKKKFSKVNKQAEENQKCRSSKDRKKNKDKKRDKDFDPLDGEGPPTPEPRCCKLQTTDLREGLKVLYLNDGLFYEGTVKALQPPDVYGVLTAGQRGSRPHILCQEEVLKDAVLDVLPGSKRYLPVGTRVCAFWSQQFSCLYPGTVAKSSSSGSDSSKTVSVDFDDEDTGRIPIEHIRLLPADFPIIEYEPDPLQNLPKKRRAQTQSDLLESEKRQKSKNVSKRNTSDSDYEEEDNEESDNSIDGDEKSGTEDSSDSTDSSLELIYWQWHGPPVRKPGQKGKIFAKGKRVYYKAITRASEVINVGDAAIFVSTGRPDFPYIGNIENLWQTASGNMMVKVRWYYHPEETKSNKKLGDLKNALFTSPHMDENDVQTIAHKCEVMTPAQFRKRGQSGDANVYYCAGHYDPVTNALTLNPGVS
ncbi:BAH and coiled-coil domain-containing protein 1, partial [Elysia marginata]